MDQVREVLRFHHYAFRTEKAYCHWILRFIRFFECRIHPREVGPAEVERFLSHLATERRVSAATQKQALNAIVFLYRDVLDRSLQGQLSPIRAKPGRRPPTVLTQAEAQALLQELVGTYQLMAKLLYGAGLRLMECVRLRVKDLDFERSRLVVRSGKGGKDRVTVLPTPLRPPLAAHLEGVRRLHMRDLEQGFGEVYLPGALARKYPRAGKEFGWQYVFPAKQTSVDPRSRKRRRHHVLESGLQKAVKRAALAAGIVKQVGCHTLRHSFATHLLEQGTNIRVLQELMGHADVTTTEIYTHVMQRDLQNVRSPLEGMNETEPVGVKPPNRPFC